MQDAVLLRTQAVFRRTAHGARKGEAPVDCRRDAWIDGMQRVKNPAKEFETASREREVEFDAPHSVVHKHLQGSLFRRCKGNHGVGWCPALPPPSLPLLSATHLDRDDRLPSRDC